MSDTDYMKRALRLAGYGKGKVSPNPLVGAVIVKDGRIIGEGYHRIFGGNHAEVEALRSAGENAEGATLYCTLEPCSHWGKTPPCVDTVIKAGIKRVVIGITDPNPLVNGRGIEKLRSAGIDVVTGVLEDRIRILNEKYIRFVTTGRPFVTVKMAQTLDGKIAKRINSRTQITNVDAQRFVHRLRTEHDAVLIGKRTAIIDNPMLTPRLVNGRHPARIILDTRLECHPSLSIFNTPSEGSVYIVTTSEDQSRIREFESQGVSFIRVKESKTGTIKLSGLLKKLGSMHISSVLVEGGAAVFSSFLRERLVDRVVLLMAPTLFGEGVNVLDKDFLMHMKPVGLEDVTRKKIGSDIMISGRPVFG